MIFVCVPWVKVDPAKKFLPHFIEWYAYNKEPHDLRLNFQMYRPLNEVQEETVEMALKHGASHVLFVEDDHWGFPVDGLEVLLEEDKDVIGFQTFRKKYPFASLAMLKKHPEKSLIGRKNDLLKDGAVLTPHERGDGPEVQKTDLLTWAFTLVKTDVFRKLEEANLYPFEKFGPVPTDSYFNQYCEDIGIERHLHFGFGIAHGEHDPKDLPELRKIETALKRHKRNPNLKEDLQKPPPSQEEIEEYTRAFRERTGLK